LGINKREYFLIPSSKDDREILRHNPEFVNYIKQRILGKYPLGHHGLLHWPMDEENGIFEFTYANREETRKKCEEALKIHKKIFGRPPDGGEVPPNWSFSIESLEVFLEYYPYVCVYKFVFPKAKPPIFAQAYLPTSGIESVEKSVSMFEEELNYYEPTVVRIVMHPQDTMSEYFQEVAYQAFSLVEDQGYKLSTYKEVFG